MPPLRLGSVPSGLKTADLFVTISDDDRALLRVDLYGDSSEESFTFQDALVWHDHVFVGFGNSIYVIDPKQQSASEISLGPHGLCATCTGSGKTIVGVNWSMRLEANKRSASEPKRLHQLLTSTTAIFAVWPSGSTCTKTVQYAAAQAECLRQDPRS